MPEVVAVLNLILEVLNQILIKLNGMAFQQLEIKSLVDQILTADNRSAEHLRHLHQSDDTRFGCVKTPFPGTHI